MSRRGPIEVVTDLLNLVSEPIRVTLLLEKTNMSYVQLIKYTTRLIEAGYMCKSKGQYTLTEDGYQFRDLMTRFTQHRMIENVN